MHACIATPNMSLHIHDIFYLNLISKNNYKSYKRNNYVINNKNKSMNVCIGMPAALPSIKTT